MAAENSRWVRGKMIGKGNFGAVSLAFDRFDGRVFAVKSVAVNSASVLQLEAIENEITILRTLSSPFVVSYISDDTTTAQETVFRNLHMEYLPGGTASELLADEELIRRYTWCLTSALKYVHSQGIVHCDVKGRNVLVGPTPGSAKLADFGSAKRVGGDDQKTPRGSPLWMAPEVVRGELQGFESDVWALGCTLIEMITGAPAWHDEGAKTLRRIGHSDELPRFPTRISDLCWDFLDKCLRRDPAERWSCDQLLTHPFLKLESTVEIEDFVSPRSVIEWAETRASEGEEESEASSADERMGNLAGSEGANWESDGWVAVRESDLGQLSCGCGGNEEPGTTWEYSECVGAKLEYRATARVKVNLTVGFCGGELAAVEDTEMHTVTTVKECTPAVLCKILLFILYCTNYLSYHNARSNILSLISYTSPHCNATNHNNKIKGCSNVHYQVRSLNPIPHECI